MNDTDIQNAALDFADLEARFGRDNACVILRTLEQFEGVVDAQVWELPLEERLKNVVGLMKENMRCQTRH